MEAMTCMTQTTLAFARQPARPRLERRPARLVVVLVIVGLLMAVGTAFQLRADAYVLCTLPIAPVFQRFFAGQPVRSMWVRAAPACPWSLRRTALATLCATAPVLAALSGLRMGDPVTVAFGIAAAGGAVALVYAVGTFDRRSRRRLGGIGIGLGVGMGVVAHIATDGTAGVAAPATIATTVLLYLPATFVVEEVLFRGVFDPFLRGAAAPSRLWDSLSLAGIAALWGVWHLPLYPGVGLEGLAFLVAFHLLVGVPLALMGRVTGSLVYPALVHAALDGLRNALVVP